MLLARRNNNSDWLTNWFEDNFFDTDLMPRTSATAPATNIKENEKAYTMEVAAPGLGKSTSTTCAVSSLTATTSSATHCQRMPTVRKFQPRLPMAYLRSRFLS